MASCCPDLCISESQSRSVPRAQYKNALPHPAPFPALWFPRWPQLRPVASKIFRRADLFVAPGSEVAAERLLMTKFLPHAPYRSRMWLWRISVPVTGLLSMILEACDWDAPFPKGRHPGRPLGKKKFPSHERAFFSESATSGAGSERCGLPKVIQCG
jgi:hypothetical protein